MPLPCSKSGTCRNCKSHTHAVLHVALRQNGSTAYVWICSRCNCQNPYNGKLYIPREEVEKYLTKEQLDALPLMMPRLENRCAKCGARDVELHHWAPTAIFGKDEAELWPKDYLCKNCHDKWHLAVTPQLVKEKP